METKECISDSEKESSGFIGDFYATFFGNRLRSFVSGGLVGAIACGAIACGAIALANKSENELPLYIPAFQTRAFEYSAEQLPTWMPENFECYIKTN